MEVIGFLRTPWPILSKDKYLMFEEAWKLAIEVQDRQWALAGAHVGTPSVCQLPGGPSHKYRSANTTCCKSWILFNAPLSDFRY